MRKAEGNKSILMYLAAGLLVIIISGLIIGGIYARYAATGSNQESARAAKVKVEFAEQTSNNLSMDFKPASGETAPNSLSVSYKFKVNNASEVAMSYSLILELPAALEDVVPSVGSNTGTKATDANTYTFTDTAWVLAPGGVTDELTLTLTGAAEKMTDGTYNDIKLYVDAVQID